MKLDRRQTILGLLSGLLLAGLPTTEAEAGPRARKRRRKTRRRVRRRIRRRIRRRVRRRTIAGRKLWVIPVAAAVGWELMLDDRVVVVKETKVIEKEGTKVEVVVVTGDDGKTEEIEVHREDTEENGADMQGSELPEGDTTTPAIETEEEVEVEE